MYTAGDINEHPDGGWEIEILDPSGDCICTLYHGSGHRFEYVKQQLHDRADALLSHLNR